MGQTSSVATSRGAFRCQRNAIILKTAWMERTNKTAQVFFSKFINKIKSDSDIRKKKMQITV